MTPLILIGTISQFWYSAPLIVVVSLVYSATRHELMQPILAHAARTALWIAGFMVVVFLLLSLLSWGL
jgi:surface polysaccharide O-acyltransferase-like enzyme